MSSITAYAIHVKPRFYRLSQSPTCGRIGYNLIERARPANNGERLERQVNRILAVDLALFFFAPCSSEVGP